MITKSLGDAVDELQAGKVLGFPTETVYGLAGRIDSDDALRLIFSTKQRPFFDPLIVHVSSMEQAQSLVVSWGPAPQALTKKFWPGPLTLVLSKRKQVSDLITSGLATVALRMPQHPQALSVIARLGVPVAAPSANRFGRTSPTTAQHVEEEFAGSVLVLDGGSCEVGIESTILALRDSTSDSNEVWIEMELLRPGRILRDDIESCLRAEGLNFKWSDSPSPVGHLPQAPGQLKHHYMPDVPLIWCDSRPPQGDHWIQQVLTDWPEGANEVRRPRVPGKYLELELPRDPQLAARMLYSEMRRLVEVEGADVLYFLVTPELKSSQDWEAILDRIRRAAGWTYLG